MSKWGEMNGRKIWKTMAYRGELTELNKPFHSTHIPTLIIPYLWVFHNHFQPPVFCCPPPQLLKSTINRKSLIKFSI